MGKVCEELLVTVAIVQVSQQEALSLDVGGDGDGLRWEGCLQAVCLKAPSCSTCL